MPFCAERPAQFELCLFVALFVMKMLKILNRDFTLFQHATILLDKALDGCKWNVSFRNVHLKFMLNVNVFDHLRRPLALPIDSHVN